MRKDRKDKPYTDKLLSVDVVQVCQTAQVQTHNAEVTKCLHEPFSGSEAVTYFVSVLQFDTREAGLAWCRKLQEGSSRRFKDKDGTSYYWRTVFPTVSLTKKIPIEEATEDTREFLEHRSFDSYFPTLEQMKDTYAVWERQSKLWCCLKKPAIYYLSHVPTLLLGNKFTRLKGCSLLPFGFLLHSYTNSGSYIISSLDGSQVENKEMNARITTDYPFVYSIHKSTLQSYNILTKQLIRRSFSSELKIDSILADNGFVLLLGGTGEILLWSSASESMRHYKISKLRVLPGMCSFSWPYLLMGGVNFIRLVDVSNSMESLYDSWFTDLNLLSLKLAKPELGVICFSNKVVFLKITDVDSFGSCPAKECEVFEFMNETVCATGHFAPGIVNYPASSQTFNFDEDPIGSLKKDLNRAVSKELFLRKQASAPLIETPKSRILKRIVSVKSPKTQPLSFSSPNAASGSVSPIVSRGSRTETEDTKTESMASENRGSLTASVESEILIITSQELNVSLKSSSSSVKSSREPSRKNLNGNNRSTSSGSSEAIIEETTAGDDSLIHWRSSSKGPKSSKTSLKPSSPKSRSSRSLSAAEKLPTNSPEPLRRSKVPRAKSSDRELSPRGKITSAQSSFHLMSSYFITGDIFGKISVRRYRDCVVVFETEPTISEEQITEVSKAADYRINDIETWNSLVIVLHEDKKIAVWRVVCDADIELQLISKIISPFPLHEIQIRDNVATLLQKVPSNDTNTPPGCCVINLAQFLAPLPECKEESIIVSSSEESFARSGSSKHKKPDLNIFGDSDDDFGLSLEDPSNAPVTFKFKARTPLADDAKP